MGQVITLTKVTIEFSAAGKHVYWFTSMSKNANYMGQVEGSGNWILDYTRVKLRHLVLGYDINSLMCGYYLRNKKLLEMYDKYLGLRGNIAK